jgi:crossover junction endodeoxyribonuclease RuvC
MSLIIGIDPGSRLTGYGIIEKDGQKIEMKEVK